MAAIAMLSGAMAAQAQSTQYPSTNSQGNQTARPATGAAPAGAASLNKADQKLVRDMAQANLAEIEAAKLAQGKAQSQEVKNFAQQMINDHTKALQEVQQLAQAKGLTLSTQVDSRHKKMEQKLSLLSGPEFDHRYLTQSGIDDHKKTHALLQRVQSRAKDADVKALAARLQPTVEQHLNSVLQLHASMGRAAGRTTSGTSGTAGSSGSGSTDHPAHKEEKPKR